MTPLITEPILDTRALAAGARSHCKTIAKAGSLSFINGALGVKREVPPNLDDVPVQDEMVAA